MPSLPFVASALLLHCLALRSIPVQRLLAPIVLCIAAVGAMFPRPSAAQFANIGGESVLFAAPFVGDELDYLRIHPEHVDFQFPRVFLNVARIGALVQVRSGARTLGGTLRSDRLRRGLYHTAILAAVSGQDLARLHPEAAATGQTRRHNAAARALLGASARLSGTAEQLERALHAADPALQTPTLSGLVAETRGIGVLALGLGLMTDFSEAEARVAFLAEAAADAELLASLSALRSVIAANRRHDPMMLAGIEDAIEDLRLLGESRLRRMRAAGASALRDNSNGIAAMVIAAKFGPMGALTVRELAEAQEILDGFTDRALIVAAMHNLAVQSQNGLHQLASEGTAPGDLRAGDMPLVGLAWLHTRLRAEATATTHAMLWIEPRENPFSAFAIGSALALSGRQALSGRHDLRADYERELARRAEDHLLTHALVLPGDEYTAPEDVAAAPAIAEPQALSFGGFDFSIPASFKEIDTGRSQIVHAPHDPESGDFHINHPDNPPVTVFLASIGSGSAVLHNTRADLRAAGYEMTEVALTAPGAAKLFDVFELVLPEGLDPAAEGRSGFERLLSAYHRGDGQQPEVAFMLLGYYLDAAQRAEYDAARALLLRSLQPEGGGPAEVASELPPAPEPPARPTRVEPCGEGTDRPGFTIPWTTTCISENTHSIYLRGEQIRNLDFFADLIAEGINLNGFGLVRPDSLENISGIVNSGLQRFRLENIPVDPAFLAPLRRTALRELRLGLLPETDGGTITLRELNGLLGPWHLHITLTEGTRLDMAAFRPGGVPEFSVTGPSGARVEFDNIRTGDSGFGTVRIGGVQSDLSGLNRISRLEKLRLDDVQGADFHRLASLSGLRNLAIDGLQGENPATLNTLFQIQRLDLRLGDGGDRAAAAAFNPGCLTHWHDLERLRLQLPGIEANLNGRDAVRDWLATLGPAPDAGTCRAGALGDMDSAERAELPRSYPIPERGRTFRSTDTAPEAGLLLLRGQPHSDREHLAVYDYRRGGFIARDIPAGTLRSALEFRGEDVPRILQNAGEGHAARISPDGRWLVTFFPHGRRPFLRLFDLGAEGREVAQVLVAEERVDHIDFITSGPNALDVLLIGGKGFTEVALRRADDARQDRWTSEVEVAREGFVTGLTIWSAARLIAPEPRRWGLSAVMSQPGTMTPHTLVSVAALRRPGEGFVEQIPVRLDEPLQGLVWLPGIEALAVHTDRHFGLLLPPHHPARERGLNSALAEQRFDIPELHYLPGRDLLLLTEPHRITAFPAQALLDWLSGTGDPLHRRGTVITEGVPDLPSLDGMHAIIGPVGQEVLVVLPGPRSRSSVAHVGVNEIPLAPLLARMDGQAGPVSGTGDAPSVRPEAPAPDAPENAAADPATAFPATGEPVDPGAPVAEALSGQAAADPPSGGQTGRAAESAWTTDNTLAQRPVGSDLAPDAPAIAAPDAIASPDRPETRVPSDPFAPAAPDALTAAQAPAPAADPLQLAEAAPAADAGGGILAGTGDGTGAPAVHNPNMTRLEREVDRALDMAVEADLSRRRAEAALDRVLAELDTMSGERDALRTALTEAEAQIRSSGEDLRSLAGQLADAEAVALEGQETARNLRRRLAESESIAADLRARVRAAETRDTELQGQLEAAEIALEEKREQLLAMAARLEAAEAASVPGDPATAREMAMLRLAAAEERSVAVRLRQRIEELEEESRRLSVAVESLGSDLNLALAMKAAEQHRRMELERAEEVHRQNMEELLIRIALLTARNEELERQLATEQDMPESRAAEGIEDRFRFVQAEQLNVRSGPFTSFEVVDRLPLGVEVEIRAQQDGWALIGPDRWVAESFLVPVRDATPLIGSAAIATREGLIGVQARMLVQGDEIVRAVMVLQRPDGTTDVRGLREIVQGGGDEVRLRTAESDGIEIVLRGPCLRLIALPGEGEVRNCAMEGDFLSGSNRFALRPQ
ncbi:MAG: hypothetical protein JJU42_09205 [Rhodobacteraceae bacterium]|nr:hypothetical protein [Paracoccaceae bacterium]